MTRCFCADGTKTEANITVMSRDNPSSRDEESGGGGGESKAANLRPRIDYCPNTSDNKHVWESGNNFCIHCGFEKPRIGGKKRKKSRKKRKKSRKKRKGRCGIFRCSKRIRYSRQPIIDDVNEFENEIDDRDRNNFDIEDNAGAVRAEGIPLGIIRNVAPYLRRRPTRSRRLTPKNSIKRVARKRKKRKTRRRKGKTRRKRRWRKKYR